MAYLPIQGRPGSGSSSGSGLPYLNSQFGDTTYTKVFVGGLAWETQSETMRRYFEQFGEILEAVVITDKNTGRSKGYGFVTFRDPEAARRACMDPTPIIDGRRANCNLASLGRPRPAMSFGRLRSPGPSLDIHMLQYEVLVTSSLFHTIISKDLCTLCTGIRHMDLNMHMHRAFTTLIWVSSIFSCMVFLEHPVRPCILMDSWVNQFKGVVIHQCKLIQCLATKLCNMVLVLML